MKFLCIAAFTLLFSLAYSQAPGAVFDLSKFKLQLPTGSGTGVDEISSSALKTYTSQYFKYDAATKEMVFWCPVNGKHTSGSKYPRTELRENQNLAWNNNGGGDWTFIGYHRLDVTMRVLTEPPSGTIAIGQVHGSKIGTKSVSGSPSIIIEFEWKKGKLVNYLRGPTYNTISQTLPGTYKLGEVFSFSMIVSGNTVSVQATKGNGAPYSYTWFKTSGASTYWMYFKVGDYVQDTGTSSTLGGRVAISKLSTTHSQSAPKAESEEFNEENQELSDGDQALSEETQELSGETPIASNDGLFTAVGILAAVVAVLTIVVIVLVVIYARRKNVEQV